MTEEILYSEESTDYQLSTLVETLFFYFLAIYLSYKLCIAFVYGWRFALPERQPPHYDSESEDTDKSIWDRELLTLSNENELTFCHIPDNYTSIEEVQTSLRRSGLEKCNLIFGIDFTASNTHQGVRTFMGKSLHAISSTELNPYQQVIKTVGKTLEVFDEDRLIPAYGFGDIATKGHSVFPLSSKEYFDGFEEVQQVYSKVVSKIQLSGPTNFAPIIYKALQIVKELRSYHILIIVADGQMTNERDTVEALEKASFWPLSIIMIGVGDGPWDMMKEFDDQLPKRNFDNFQFVDYHSVTYRDESCRCDFDIQANFALNALMEIPEQYKIIRRLGLLEFDEDDSY